VTRYTRQDVLRILRLQAQQLVAWERADLIPVIAEGEAYSFEHLSRLRALREMRSKRISARSIRAQVDAMQRVAGMRNALVESSAVRHGSRLVFRHGGALVDPLTQQLAFDFANAECRQLTMVGDNGSRGRQASAAGAAQQASQLQEMFARAVQFEETPNATDHAVRAYYEILDIKPDHAAACINLGTIFYNQRGFTEAERMYRRATEADPAYALAFFDLGNVLDEMQQLMEAIGAYKTAIKLVPGYADAHYNLALAYERQGERRRALRHWMAYTRLDPIGPWAAHAKTQARKILGMERLSIVSRGGMRVSQAS
jgi:tetratricopeptide (TPR) repeat protein